eukprot:2961153-Prymnesium_polylepis.1
MRRHLPLLEAWLRVERAVAVDAAAITAARRFTHAIAGAAAAAAPSSPPPSPPSPPPPPPDAHVALEVDPRAWHRSAIRAGGHLTYGAPSDRNRPPP